MSEEAASQTTPSATPSASAEEPQTNSQEQVQETFLEQTETAEPEPQKPVLRQTEPGSIPPLSSPDKKVVVVGIGGAGAKTLTKLSALPGAGWLKLFAIDTDRETLKACSAENRLLAASEWREGVGCGGDVLKGERSISRERARLTQLLEGSSLLIVVGGLGGGTATGGARILASIAKSSSIPALFILGTPFTFEAHSRRKAAEDCIDELLPLVDLMLCLPNDLLFSTLAPDVPVEEAFSKASEELAGAVFGTAEILRCRNVMGADFASLMSALHERRAACGIGVGRASLDEGLNRCHIALQRVLASPFLGGVAKLEASDAAIVSITGGPDLEIGETRKTLETISALIGPNAELVIGTNTDPALTGSVQMTVVSIKYDRLPEKPAVSNETARNWGSGSRGLKQAKESSAQSKKLEQGLFELQSYSKGIFSKNAPTKYKDEDLDIPTFQRRNVSIDKGNVGR